MRRAIIPIAQNFRDSIFGKDGISLGKLCLQPQSSSKAHGDVLAILRTIVRRYTPATLTTEQMTILQTVTHRLQTEKLYQEDVIATARMLHEVDLDTLLDLSPVADQLFPLYLDEFVRP